MAGRFVRQSLHIEPEQRINAIGGVYLGCRHIVATIRLLAGITATTMTYDMDDFLKSRIPRYREVAGYKVPLRNYSTPFLAEDHKEALAGALGVGPVRECPWCYHAGPPARFVQYSLVDKLPLRRKVKAETFAESDAVEEQSVTTGKNKPIPDEDALASVACIFYEDSMGRAVGTPGYFASSQSPRN